MDHGSGSAPGGCCRRCHVAQTSESAVSQVSKPAGRAGGLHRANCVSRRSHRAPCRLWKSATQQVWKPALEFGHFWEEIPKGFRPKAQGCEARATLGNKGERASTPTGLWQWKTVQTQPRWGWVRYGGGVPRVGAARQPWALLRNPVGIHGWMLAGAAPIAPIPLKTSKLQSRLGSATGSIPPPWPSRPQ